jgi:hypothetical protein
MVRRLVLIGTVAVATTGTALAADTDAQRAELQRNEALWAKQHLRDYRFRLRVLCFCPGGRVTITVRHGKPSGAPVDRRGLDTVPEMFAAIQRALDRGADSVNVRYSAHRGFPRWVAIDPRFAMQDDEIAWIVDRFTVLHPVSRR